MKKNTLLPSQHQNNSLQNSSAPKELGAKRARHQIVVAKKVLSLEAEMSPISHESIECEAFTLLIVDTQTVLTQ